MKYPPIIATTHTHPGIRIDLVCGATAFCCGVVDGDGDGDGDGVYGELEFTRRGVPDELGLAVGAVC
jgi:hypothetical protein